MLKVNSTSSAMGGNGKMTMARTARSPTGTPMPLASNAFRLLRLTSAINPYSVKLITGNSGGVS